MSSEYRSIGVERHRHGDTGPPHMVQARLASIVNVTDVTGRDDAQLRIIGTPTHANREFVAGDYVVVRDGPGFAMSWGKVNSVNSDLARHEDKLVHSVFGVNTSGWWDFLKRSGIYVLMVDSPAGGSVGTLFQYQDWAQMVAEYPAIAAGETAGVFLARMFRDLARVRLPESLGGEFIGDSIPIVYDDETAAMYAPMFAGLDPVDTGVLIPDVVASLFGVRTASVGSLLTSVFVPEPMLIELFPALVEGGTEPYNALASALGRRPVLVYRIKPFRMAPLYQSAVAKTTYSFEDVEAASRTISGDLTTGGAPQTISDVVTAAQDLIASGRPSPTTPDQKRAEAMKRLANKRLESQGRNRELLVTDGMFARVSFDPTNPQQVVGLPQSIVNRITRQAQDSARVNATTINITPGGGASLDSSVEASLPIFTDDQVEKHGLRLHKANWPFYAANSRSLVEFYRAVAAQVMQFQSNAHLLETGTIHLRYKAATVYEEDESAGQTTFRPEVDVRPGVWFRLKLEGTEEYFGYVTAVQHKVAKDITGRKPGETTMNFVRGHYASESALLMQPNVPIGFPPPGTTRARIAGAVAPATGLLGSRVSVTPPPQVKSTFIPKKRGTSADRTTQSFIFAGNELATPFKVSHHPFDVADHTRFRAEYQVVRPYLPDKCVVHINAGPVTTNVTAVYNYLNRVKFASVDADQVAAHILIESDGSVHQFFDLAIPVSHTGSDVVFNRRSVSVEFVVPARLTGGTTQELGARFAAARLTRPWPAVPDDFRFLYTDEISGAGPYNEREGYPFSFAPNASQLGAFRKVAKALNSHFPIPLAAIPTPRPNTLVRNRQMVGRVNMFLNPAWGFFHHCQLELDRVDAHGVDLPALLGGL